MNIYEGTNNLVSGAFLKCFSILFQVMFLDRRHPLIQKSYFCQNVIYTVFALR